AKPEASGRSGPERRSKRKSQQTQLFAQSRPRFRGRPERWARLPWRSKKTGRGGLREEARFKGMFRQNPEAVLRRCRVLCRPDGLLSSFLPDATNPAQAKTKNR